MIKKLRNQPYAPKWEQEEEKKNIQDTIFLPNTLNTNKEKMQSYTYSYKPVKHTIRISIQNQAEPQRNASVNEI
jgi:hypothetical protein